MCWRLLLRIFLLKTTILNKRFEELKELLDTSDITFNDVSTTLSLRFLRRHLSRCERIDEIIDYDHVTLIKRQVLLALAKRWLRTRELISTRKRLRISFVAFVKRVCCCKSRMFTFNNDLNLLREIVVKTLILDWLRMKSSIFNSTIFERFVVLKYKRRSLDDESSSIFAEYLSAAWARSSTFVLWKNSVEIYQASTRRKDDASTTLCQC